MLQSIAPAVLHDAVCCFLVAPGEKQFDALQPLNISKVADDALKKLQASFGFLPDSKAERAAGDMALQAEINDLQREVARLNAANGTVCKLPSF